MGKKEYKEKYYLTGAARITLWAEFDEPGVLYKIELNNLQTGLIQDFLETLRKADPFEVSKESYKFYQLPE